MMARRSLRDWPNKVNKRVQQARNLDNLQAQSHHQNADMKQHLQWRFLVTCLSKLNKLRSRLNRQGQWSSRMSSTSFHET